MSETSGDASPPSELPLATRVVRGGLVVALASYATILIGFSATVVMTRLVSPRDFGTMAIATFLFGLINLRTKVGLGQAFVHSPETTGRAIGTLFTLDMGAGLFSFLLALAAVPFLTWFGYAPDVAWVVLALAVLGLLEASASTPGLLMDKELLFGRTTVITTISLAASYAPAIVLALKGFGVWSLIAQAATQSTLVLFGFWWVARRDLQSPWQVRWTFDRSLAKGFVRFGLVWGSAALAGFLTTQFDNFLVGTFLGLTTLGFYDRAYRLALWSSVLVTTIVSRTTFFAYAKLQQDRIRLSKTFDMSLWIITSLALPLALVLFVSASDLVQFLYGEQWAPAAQLLRFLLVASLIRPLLDDLDALLIAIGKPQLASQVHWIQAVVVIVVAGVLTFLYGAPGTAVGVGIAFIVGGVLLYRFAARLIDIAWRPALGLPLVATALTLLLEIALDAGLNLDGLPLVPRLVLKTAATAAIFYVITMLMQRRVFFEHARYIFRLARGTA